MSFLLIGGSGNVGSHIAKELVEQGENPIIFDVVPPNKILLGDSASKVKFVRGDIVNLAEIISTIKENNVTRIIQTASILTGECEKRPFVAMKVNIEGTVNVLEACRFTDVERLIYTSSSSVYGKGGLEDAKITEDFPRNPESIYGVTKLAGEIFGQTYVQKYGLQLIVLRLRLVYGPGQRTGISVITDELIGKTLRGQQAALPYDPTLKLTITYVKDSAHAHLLAAKAPMPKHLFFNINSGATTIGEMVDTVKALIPSADVKLGQGMQTTAKFPMQEHYAKQSGIFSISLAKAELGYEPRYDVKEGIKDLIEYEKTLLVHKDR